jgi:hypothetical protein
LTDVSTILSTLTFYNAIEACLIVNNYQTIVCLDGVVAGIRDNLTDVSKILSTLTYYNAVEACMIVQNTQGLSTLSSSVNTLNNQASNFASRKSVPFSTLNVLTTPVGHIVSTVVSTLGWLNTFRNDTGIVQNLELQLGTLGLWPNTGFDAMRFSHIGPLTDSLVRVFAQDSSQAASYLGDISAGQTFTYVFRNGINPNVGTNRSLSTNYIRITGH